MTTYHHRVTRCEHGIAIGLPGLRCEVVGCVAGPPARSAPTGAKRCQRCGYVKPVRAFYERHDGLPRSRCMSCENRLRAVAREGARQ